MIESYPYWLYYEAPITEGPDERMKITTFAGEAIKLSVDGKKFEHVTAIINDPDRSTRTLITYTNDYLSLFVI